MRLNILGSNIHNTSYQSGENYVINWAHKNEARIVFAANVHMVMEAYDSPEFQQIVNSADLVTPDGMPLVWALRLKGIKDQQRVYGPTLMLEILASAAKEGIPVGFLGSTKDVLKKLTENMMVRFQGLIIGIKIAPPFRMLTPAEDQETIQRVNDSGVKILFVGLGCPKQEYWMAEHRGKIKAVMIGVGAAFDFHAGMVRQAPPWMQKSGLEWLFRLIQEPGRLWRRYLLNNPRFVIQIIIEILREKINQHKGNT